MPPAVCAAAEPLDDRVRSPKETIFLDGRPLSAVYAEYRPKLYSFFLQKTRSHADADDLVSQTFVRVLQYHDQYQSGTNLNAWLYRIAFTTFVNRYRRQRFEAEHFTSSDVPEMYALEQPETPETLVSRREIVAQTQRAVDRLPEEFRDTAWLDLFRDYECKETASALDIPVGTVLSRLHRARKRLQRDEGLYEALK